jgi:hypothetical protein
MSNEQDLTRIHTSHSEVDAQMIKGFLEGEGIQTYIQGLNHRSMLGFAGPYIELHILVRKLDEERARELVEHFLNQEQEIIFEEHEEHVGAQDLAPAEDRRGEPMCSPASSKTESIEQKNWKKALMYSFFFPGIGNCYAGRKEIGGWFLTFGAIAYLFLIFGQGYFDLWLRNTNIYLLAFSSIGILIIIDAITAVGYLRNKVGAGFKPAPTDPQNS